MVTIGLLAMGAGLLVYLADREAGHAALIPATAMLSTGPVFGAVGQWLPSFVHPFAFALFSAAVASRTTPAAYRVCTMWWMVNVVFEVGQHPSVNTALAESIASAPGVGRMTQRLADYFLLGTFDALDIVAATAGAAAAVGVLMFVNRWDGRHEH